MKRITLLTFVALISLFCSSCNRIHVKEKVAATIPVAHERLYLAPLVSEAVMEKIPGWPQDPEQQEVLLQSLNGIWNKLKAEFHRCEKKGLYEMTEDSENPTMRISVIITSVELYGDTLSMPVRLEAERIPDGQHFIYTIPAYSHSQGQQNQFHHIGLLLLNYKRTFPYKLIVSFFYAH